MPLIIIIALLCALKYFEVWRFAELSWWWIVALMGLAFVWFEVVEPALGLDKKKAHADDEKRRKERAAEMLKKPAGKGFKSK